tara:strand:+ start:78 stop:515 length:438 start_codon:yes stop_codon:yes gene_type:complete
MAKIKRAVKQAASKQKTAAQKRAATIKRNKAAAEKKRKEALARGRRRSNIATIAALGTIATTTPIMLSKGKKKPQQLTRKEVKDSKPGELTGFGKAFRTARNKGMGTEFTYNNKKYVAVTKDDLARKNMTLAQYVRSKRDGLRQK